MFKRIKHVRRHMEYRREIVSMPSGAVYIVYANGVLIIYSYCDSDCSRLNCYLKLVHELVVSTASRLELPVRYYYRDFNTDRVDYLHYDYRVRTMTRH